MAAIKRNKRSLYNAMSAALLTLANGLLGLLTTKFILRAFGSDFNGLNSTANQFVTVLMLLEGGFTIATNVALFKPYMDKDYGTVGRIISATRATFKKLGALSFFAGIGIAVGYSFVVNSALSRPLVISILAMTLIPASFNLFYTTKYRILIQAEQKEYVISLITLATLSAGYILNIVFIHLGSAMWTVRFVTMCLSFVNSVAIAFYVRRKMPFVNYRAEPDFQAIKGTRDVFAQKLTSVFYTTAPILSITISSGGTMLASVYAIYNSVLSLLKGVMHSVIDAPRLSLGELAAEDSKKRLWNVFEEYQLIVLLILSVLLSVAAVLIMPFIRLYTHEINDIDYHQPVIAVLLILAAFFELLHIPSGHLINMTGNFKVSRNIQILACVILVAMVVIGALANSLVVILAATLTAAIVLASLEIGYIHCLYFEKKLLRFLKLLCPLVFLVLPLVFLELWLLPEINSYLMFGLFGVLLAAGNGAVCLGVCLLFHRRLTRSLITRFVNILRRKKR